MFSIRKAGESDAAGILECLRSSFEPYEKNGYRASGRVADFFGMPLFQYVKPLRQ